jgi:hypothetical protein
VVIVIEELVLQLEQGPVCEAFINCSCMVSAGGLYGFENVLCCSRKCSLLFAKNLLE